MFQATCPAKTIRCPGPPNNAAAPLLLHAAQGDRPLLVRVTVEMLLRTGPWVGGYTGLR